MVAILFLSQLLIDESDLDHNCSKASYSIHCLDEVDPTKSSLEQVVDTSLCQRNASRNKQQKRRRQRHVHFSDTERIYTIPNRKEYSRQERLNMFMTQQDHKRMQEEILTCLVKHRIVERTPTTIANTETTQSKSNEEGKLSNKKKEDLPSLRGLECFTEQYRVDKMCRTKRAIQTILQRQRGKKNLSEEWLETSYRPFSIEAAKVARNSAIRDEQAIPSPFPKSQVMVR